MLYGYLYESEGNKIYAFSTGDVEQYQLSCIKGNRQRDAQHHFTGKNFIAWIVKTETNAEL